MSHQEAARLLRERADSYAKDVEALTHEGDLADRDEIVLLSAIRDELRKIATEVER